MYVNLGLDEGGSIYQSSCSLPKKGIGMHQQSLQM